MAGTWQGDDAEPQTENIYRSYVVYTCAHTHTHTHTHTLCMGNYDIGSVQTD